MTHFWGPVGFSTPLENIEVDLRAGGIFKTIMVDDASGADYPSIGYFVEIVAPESWSGVSLMSKVGCSPPRTSRTSATDAPR